MRPKVFVSRIIPDAGLNLIREACEAEIWPEVMPPPYEIMAEKVKTVEGLLTTLNDRIDASLIAGAGTQLKVISQMAVGYDNIDAKAAQARGIRVGNTPGVLTDATADLAFALLLAAARRIVEGVEYIRAGNWQTWEPKALLGGDLSGATLGIIGLGRIGEAVARRARHDPIDAQLGELLRDPFRPVALHEGEPDRDGRHRPVHVLDRLVRTPRSCAIYGTGPICRNKVIPSRRNPIQPVLAEVIGSSIDYIPECPFAIRSIGGSQQLHGDPGQRLAG
jgi:hypothetical protein